ncbi:hypothetical protein MYCTH_2314370 [Thermothelomyces thermophilus ATCC 42464]|uniref:LITAF domain-containing protein n=1 Tax=Thermothelomyces thermophilus (strain ATCC 42464 / BCRC 31852 / DSM 1799) TaxID=573729 RepID=G2Q071_THET4|nr:uncharacterized protein MYCTH_2314370 [Thermothelomyces thermophilus ATCC 42464]AEO55745.1 hypothetical protein MYCTH_2314370 [Thermothelomyces thermophilus ATCC 42464]
MQQETQPHTDPASHDTDTIETAPPSVDTPRDGEGSQDANHAPSPSFTPVEETPGSPVVSREPEPYPYMEPQPPYIGVIPVNQLTGEQPQWIECPFCQQTALTRVSKEGSRMQTVGVVLCCIFCVLFTPLPCLCGWCEVLNYYCSNCNNKLATRRDRYEPLLVLAPAAKKPS